MKELIKIQTELQAKKNQRNNFGKYNYRSCEDILEALKPHLKANKCFVNLNDDIIEVAGRVFVKSTVSITNEKGDRVDTTALAELPTQQSGMSLSQITGSASSYARKYALNGLFAIDDAVHEAVQEVDSTNKQETKQTSRPKVKPAPQKTTPKQELTQDTIEGIEKVTREKLKGIPLNDEWVKWLQNIMPKFKEASNVKQAKDIQQFIYDHLQI